jgi:hypothetical protein
MQHWQRPIPAGTSCCRLTVAGRLRPLLKAQWQPSSVGPTGPLRGPDWQGGTAQPRARPGHRTGSLSSESSNLPVNLKPKPSDQPNRNHGRMGLRLTRHHGQSGPIGLRKAGSPDGAPGHRPGRPVSSLSLSHGAHSGSCILNEDLSLQVQKWATPKKLRNGKLSNYGNYKIGCYVPVQVHVQNKPLVLIVLAVHS